MIEISGDIWDYRDSAIIAITTNGQVAKSGKAVMGRGVAAQACKIMPEIQEILGRHIVEGGNHVHYLGGGIVSFPVEHSPFEVPDLALIERSACELAALADAMGWQQVIVPRPGCGGGGLSWKDVRPLLERHLDGRFRVISPAE